MAQYASQRIRSMILGGSGADGRSRIGSGSRKALKAGGAAAIAGLWGVAISESIRARLLANDVIALDACLVDEMGFAAVLPTMKMPCLLYVGSADPNFPAMQETAAEIPSATLFTLPGLGHTEPLLRIELVLPHVIEFLDKVAKGS